MYPKTKYIALFFFLFSLLTQLCYSQTDSLPSVRPVGKLARPSLEIGLGNLTYFGDIGKLNGITRTPQLNWGYHVALQNPLSDAFGLNVFALFGKICDAEYLPGRGANFQTEIRMGGLALTYNFNHFLPKDRLISPYLSLGISTFEFNPKSDLRDAEGNWYHAWEDGTIRNLPQADKDAGTATILQRDYVYETDLRAVNGRESSQALRALSIPLGAGANIHINNKFNFRLGAEYHFTTTDDLDGIHSENLGGNLGARGNDRFLYASLGLAYNLHFDKKSPAGIERYTGENLMALVEEDEDGDGVADIVDLCPFTPKGVQIDLYGCPLDSDKDRVPDYLDQEPNSARGAIVNALGVTMTEEEIEKIYLVYSDSLGNHHYAKSKTSTDDFARNKLKIGDRNKGYRIILNDGDMSSANISRLLSISDLKSYNTGAGTEYYVGDFENMESAVQRMLRLDQEGVATKLVYNEFGKITDVNKKDIEAVAIGSNTIDESDDVTFRVQIGAYRYKLPAGVFKEVPDVLVVEGNDGLIRYVSGSFDNIKEAAEHKINLLLKGYEGAFVSAYKRGKRITLKEAGATVNAKEDISSGGPSGKFNKEFVKFTVQLGTFNGRVPAETLNSYMSLPKVRPIRAENGVTRYVFGSFDSLEEANEAMKSIEGKGYGEPMVVGEFNGQLINAEEAQKIKTQ